MDPQLAYKDKTSWTPSRFISKLHIITYYHILPIIITIVNNYDNNIINKTMFYLFNSEYFANQFTGPLRLSPRNMVTRLMGYTVCQRSSYPFYILSYIYKIGNYFLDIAPSRLPHHTGGTHRQNFQLVCKPLVLSMLAPSAQEVAIHFYSNLLHKMGHSSLDRQ